MSTRLFGRTETTRDGQPGQTSGRPAGSLAVLTGERRGGLARASDQPGGQPSRPATGGLAHIRSLDGLRGVAVLAVVVFHFAPGVAPGGFLGVDIFFVLSGFLITSLLVSEYGTRGHISLRSFWVRRARRLLPALFLVLGVVGIYALADPNRVAGQHLAVDGLFTFAYAANWHFIASNQSYIQQFINETSALRHTWSLAIEEQFYLVWPLLVAGLGAFVGMHARRRGAARRRLQRSVAVVCLTLGACSAAAMALLYRGGDPSRVYYGTDTHAHVLLVGAALGALTAGAPTVRRQARRILLVVLGCVAAIGVSAAFVELSTTSGWLYRGGYVLVGVTVAVVLAAAAQPGPNPLRALLETRLLVGLGLISYGVYLWHWPIAVWCTPATIGLSGPWLFVFRAALTLGVSLASYRFVEQPIRRGRLPRLGGVRPAVVVVAAVTLVAVLLEVPALALPSVAGSPSAAPSKGASSVSLRYAHAPRCDGPPSAAERLQVHGHPLRALLIGNSYAGETYSCLATILQARGATLSLIGATGYTICEPSVLSAIKARLAKPSSRPDVMMLFALPPSTGPQAGNTAESLPPSLTRPAQTACTIQKNFVAHLRSFIDLSRRAGAFVVFVVDPPPAGHTTSSDTTTAIYERLARSQPGDVGLADAGLFLRDPKGVYQWRMPCVPGGEVGCAPDRTIPVRYPTDQGYHFCADPTWGLGSKTGECDAGFRGGERRVAAALALMLQARFGR